MVKWYHLCFQLRSGGFDSYTVCQSFESPVAIDDKDIRVEAYSHDGVRRSGLKVTHIPTGLVAICDKDADQLRNLRVAKEMLEAGISSPYLR